jgi:hypothetical protein
MIVFTIKCIICIVFIIINDKENKRLLNAYYGTNKMVGKKNLAVWLFDCLKKKEKKSG